MGSVQLTAIFGPPGAGKAGQVVSAVLEQRSLEGGVYLVVPGAVDRSRYLRELAAREPMLLDVEVGTWSGLVQRLAAAPARRSDEALERVVVRDALASVPELGRALRFAGFVDTARRVVADIRRAEAWGGAAEVGRVLEQVPGGSPDAWRRLAARVGELLAERRLHDAAWFEARAALRIRRRQLDVGAVVAVDHAAPASVRVHMVEQLAALVPVTIALPWRPGRALHDPVARLRDRWTASPGVVMPAVDTGARDGSPVLDWLASELYEPSPASAPAWDGSGAAPLAFVECCGRGQELEEVVREVVRLREAGIAAGSIAVTAARVDRDIDALLTGLAQAGVPTAPMVRRRAPDVPAGRTVLDLVAAASSDDPRRLLAALAGAITPVRRRRLDIADLALRRTGRTASIADACSLPAVAGVLPAGVLAVCEAAASGTGVLAAMRSMLAELRPQGDGDLRLLAALAHALESLATAAGGEQHVRLEDVVALVELLPLEVPDRSDEDAVVVAAIQDLGSVRFDAVVLYGMDDGAFRARAEDLADVPSAARDLVHLAVTRPRRVLSVVRRAADDDGGRIAPHPVWRELDRLANLAAGARSIRRRGLGAVVPEPGDVLLPNERALSVALARSGGATVLGVEPAVEAALDAARFVPAEEAIEGDALERIRAATRVAATELEAWSRCPVQWLLGRELGLADPDDPRERLVAGSYAHALLEAVVPQLHERGRHDLDSIRGAIRAERRAALRRVDRDEVLELHDVERVERQVEETITAEHELDGYVAPDDVLVEVALDSRLAVPGSPEAEAARGAAPPWSTTGLHLDGVEVHGRVDRIDVYGDEVVLHDYKSSSKKVSPAKLVSEHALQLPLYWLAIERNPHAPTPVAAVYRLLPKRGELAGLRSARLKELGLLSKGMAPPKPEVIADVLEAAEERAREVIAGMRSGSLLTEHIDPGNDRGPCRTCSFASVCRIQDRVRERAREVDSGTSEEVPA